jgi:hypothetical protein
MGGVPKEIAATILFTAAGIVGLILSPADWPTTLPGAIFYAVLVVNTWFSIRFFSNLPPVERDESIIDGILAVLYVALAFALGQTVTFLAIATILFAFAIPKYALLLRLIDFPHTLKRKMVFDALGTLLCLAALIGALAGYPMESIWVLAVVFTLANLILLTVWPMYRVLAPDQSGQIPRG